MEKVCVAIQQIGEKIMNIHPYANDIFQQVKQWRHHLHAHPEIGMEEYNTSAFVKEKLTAMGIAYQTFAGTGVVAKITKGTGNRAIGFRADMDALPMTEMNSFAHKSTRDGMMHACGHDGHTAVLLGAAQALLHAGNFDGTVYLIFQPGEEGYAGAKHMIDDGLFTACPMDQVYAFHNWPELPFGQAGAITGAVMAGGARIAITITGQGGHAALPHTSRDPLPIASQLITALQTIVSRNVNPADSVALSPCVINGGQVGAYAVIPDVVEIVGTVRTLKTMVEDEVEQRMQSIAKGFSIAFDCDITLDFRRGYRPTVNHGEPTQTAGTSVGAVLGADNVHWTLPAAMTGEDFSFMLNKVPGNYLWLGSGQPDQNLHTTHYDFNDDLIPVGMSYWLSLASACLPVQGKGD